MNSKTIRRLTLLAALGLAPTALAVTPKEPPPPAREAPAARESQAGLSSSDMKIGVGLAVIGADNLSTVNPVNIYVPIDLGKIRIEPWLGFGRRGATTPGGSSTTVFGIGAGGFLLLKASKSINAYGGGRLGLNIISAGSSLTDISVLPAAGVEWLPDPHFSFGIEAQLGLVFHTGGGSSSTDFGTNGLVFLRAYL